MKIYPSIYRHGQGGYALMMVLVLSGVSVLILAGALKWTSTNARLNDRNNQYYKAIGAAEAATEQVLSVLAGDFRYQGDVAVINNFSTYKTQIPKAADHAMWANYRFSDGKGNNDQISVTKIASLSYTNLQSQYAGLSGFASTYRLVADATDQRSFGAPLIGAVQQDVQTAIVPIFQHAIFYSVDLEMNPGKDMTIKGRVHSNGNIYTQPGGSTLTFLTDVTSSQQIIANKKPGDPSVRSGGTVVFDGEHDSGTVSEVLPIGTNNSPDAVHAILEIPPVGESVNSPMGQQRYYNKANLAIIRDNSTNGWTIWRTVTNGVGTTSARTNLSWANVSSFVSTNSSFYDAREGKTMDVIDIDVAKFRAWNTANNSKGDFQILYVADARAGSPGTSEPAVRLSNGQQLPPSGFTVATPDPLYVKGDYNTTVNGSTFSSGTNTANTLPASLAGDAITVLSSSWNDANGTNSLGSRNASSTTVNAAFLAGIVETANGIYSGGVENFPRFLEDWSGALTYNGSMVVLYYSKIANHSWQNTGIYYNPPTRNWSFDFNFLNPAKQPPGTPGIRLIIRGKWLVIAPNT